MAAKGHRRAALASVEANGNGRAPVRVIPAAPGDLEAAGLAVWSACWELDRTSGEDAVSIERLARMEDESAKLRKLISEQGVFQREPIITPRGESVGERLVPHPGMAMLRRLEKASRELGQELGLTAHARKRLGIEPRVAPEPPDALDELRASRALRRHRMLNGEAE